MAALPVVFTFGCGAEPSEFSESLAHPLDNTAEMDLNLGCHLGYRADPSRMTMTVTNDGNAPASILPWNLPLGSHVDVKKFRVFHGEEELAFWGIAAANASPTEADFLTLLPGESREAVYRLASYYDLSRSGEYTVELLSPFFQTTQQDGTGSKLFLHGCEPLRFALHYPEPLDVDPSSVVHPESFMLKDASTFDDCSSSQRQQVLAAEPHALMATRYAAADIPEWNAYSSTWFGTYSYARMVDVLIVDGLLQEALEDGISAGADYECETSCESGSAAYVATFEPTVIHLCPLFFTFPTTGTPPGYDGYYSQMSMILHELSHWKAGTDDVEIPGTDDIAYGAAACRQLATQWPDLAVSNGDNYNHFFGAVHGGWEAAIFSVAASLL